MRERRLGDHEVLENVAARIETRLLAVDDDDDDDDGAICPRV
jgi:hypothetical protein